MAADEFAALLRVTLDTRDVGLTEQLLGDASVRCLNDLRALEQEDWHELGLLTMVRSKLQAAAAAMREDSMDDVLIAIMKEVCALLEIQYKDLEGKVTDIRTLLQHCIQTLDRQAADVQKERAKEAHMQATDEVKGTKQKAARDRPAKVQPTRPAEQAMQEHMARQHRTRERQHAGYNHAAADGDLVESVGVIAESHGDVIMTADKAERAAAKKAEKAAEREKAAALAAQKVAAEAAAAQERETLRRQKGEEAAAKKAAAAEEARQQAERKRRDKEEEAARKATEKAAKKKALNIGMPSAANEAPSADPSSPVSSASAVASGRLERSRIRTAELPSVESVLDDEEGRRVSYTLYSGAGTSAPVARRSFAGDDANARAADAALRDAAANAAPASDTGVTMDGLVLQCKLLEPDRSEELGALLDAFNAYELPKKQFNARLRDIMGIDKVREALSNLVPDQLLSKDENLRSSIIKNG